MMVEQNLQLMQKNEVNPIFCLENDSNYFIKVLN